MPTITRYLKVTCEANSDMFDEHIIGIEEVCEAVTTLMNTGEYNVNMYEHITDMESVVFVNVEEAEIIHTLLRRTIPDQLAGDNKDTLMSLALKYRGMAEKFQTPY